MIINTRLKTDIVTGEKYVYRENTCNLFLFTDEVKYNKSGNSSIWALFSCIVELPPKLHYKIENIIYHSTIGGAEPEFNNFLSVYNSEIDTILLDGIGNYKIKIHAATGDSPALAKICKINGHNGYNSCLKCMHPGVHLGKGIS